MVSSRFPKGNIPWNEGKTYSSHPRSEEARKRMREAAKGKVKSLEHRLAISASMNNLAPEIKQRKAQAVSAAQKGRPNYLRGRKLNRPAWNKGIHTNKHSWNYKGGISKIDKLIRAMFEYGQWRSDCYERDNWTCQTCGHRGGYMTVHHTKSFHAILRENRIQTIIDAASCPELWDVNNGVTLCEDCHALTDNYRGRQKGVHCGHGL